MLHALCLCAHCCSNMLCHAVANVTRIGATDLDAMAEPFVNEIKGTSKVFIDAKHTYGVIVSSLESGTTMVGAAAPARVLRVYSPYGLTSQSFGLHNEEAQSFPDHRRRWRRQL